MGSKEKLRRMVGVLSEYECDHLLHLVHNTAAGQRFWEDDISILYNEYAKVHSIQGNGAAPIAPPGPDEHAGIFAPIPVVKPYPRAERVPLPEPQIISSDLGQALLNRRSRREYRDASISSDQLSTLLSHACGTAGFGPGYDYTCLPLRRFPSAGGLQAPELYLLVSAVQGIPAGLYHYHPMDHVLECLDRTHPRTYLGNIALGQSFIETAAVVFAISGYYERLRWKYGERAYRYMCMDVGFLGENLYLVTEALGLGMCAIAGFADDAMERVLGIDGRDEMVLLLMTLGVLGAD